VKEILMGMRLNTNVASLEVQKNLKIAQAEQESEFAKLSTGKRITKASDDAAGFAISKKIESEVRAMRVAGRNANDAISIVQVAEGNLNETGVILNRLRELSMQSASDTIGDTEREYLSMEYNQLVQEADRISRSSALNGRPLLTGENIDFEFQVGTKNAAHDRIHFSSGGVDASSEGLGISGTDVKSKSDAIGNLSVLDNAINKVNGFRAQFGSVQSRLQATINNLDVAVLNQDMARARIEDLDYADSTAKAITSQIKAAAGVSVLAQTNQLGGNALKLIG